MPNVIYGKKSFPGKPYALELINTEFFFSFIIKTSLKKEKPEKPKEKRIY